MVERGLLDPTPTRRTSLEQSDSAAQETCVPPSKSAARVGIDRKGVVTVATDMTDIGAGRYTVIAQTAAEMLGVDLDKVVYPACWLQLPGVRPLGRPVRRQQFLVGRLRRVREAARGPGLQGRLDPADAAFDDGKVRVRDYPITLDKTLAGWTKA